jgi:hypothetical protein
MSTIVSILKETEEIRSISSEQGLEEDLRERRPKGGGERRVLTCYQQPSWAASPTDPKQRRD